MKKAVFYDSHKRFKAFEVFPNEHESTREFERRTYKQYLELISKYEFDGSGERVYLRYDEMEG